MRRVRLVSVLAAALAACTPSAFRGAPVPDGDILFAPEIVRAQVLDTYQAVTRLRPQFLRWRPVDITKSERASLRVYLDDTDVGGIDALRNIPIDQVTAIRYVGPSAAQFRWGSRHAAGVIQVSTRRTLDP